MDNNKVGMLDIFRLKIIMMVFYSFLSSYSFASTWVPDIEEPKAGTGTITTSDGDTRILISGYSGALTLRPSNRKENICSIYNFNKDSISVILSNDESVLAGVTALALNNKNVYVMARHAFVNSGLSEPEFKKNYENLKIYEVQDGNEVLDVLFIANDLNTVSDLINKNSELQNYNRSWASWQFGSLVSRELTFGCSSGGSFESEFSTDNQKTGYLGLSNTMNNFSSSGSSGAIVWGYSDKTQNIHPFGVIMCLQEFPETPQKKIMRVLGFDKIKQSTIKELSFSQAIKPANNFQRHENCQPVDRNTIGGEAIRDTDSAW